MIDWIVPSFYYVGLLDNHQVAHLFSRIGHSLNALLALLYDIYTRLSRHHNSIKKGIFRHKLCGYSQIRIGFMSNPVYCACYIGQVGPTRRIMSSIGFVMCFE